MNLKSFILKNSTEILLGISVSGYILSMISVAKTASRLEKEKKKIGKLEKRERIVYYTSCYAPSLALGLITISSIMGNHRLHLTRTAAAMSLYELAKNNLQDYRDQVRETIGEKKTKLLEGDVSQKRLNRSLMPEKITGTGSVLCYDDLSGRFFYCDMETLRKTQNDFNKTLLGGENIKPLNDFYYDIGLSQIKLGENIGWEVGRNMMDLEFDTKISPSGKPCLVVRHKSMPTLIW